MSAVGGQQLSGGGGGAAGRQRAAAGGAARSTWAQQRRVDIMKPARFRTVRAQCHADFETVKLIYLRKPGETAAYQLHTGLRAVRGAHMGLGRGRSCAGAPPTSGRARPQTESAPKAPSAVAMPYGKS